MKKHPVEEKFPLLLLYVEENGKKSDFPQRVVFADKGRAQVTSCWFTSISIALTFILLTFVIFMATLNPLLHPIHPRCTRDLKNYHGYKIIHVVKQGLDWNSKQLDILKFIADTYPKFEINNIIVDVSKKNFMKHEMKNASSSSSVPKKTTSATIIKAAVPISSGRQKGLLFPEITSIFFRKFNEIIARDREIFNREDNVRNFRKSNENAIEANMSLPFLRRTKRSPEELTYSGVLSAHKNIKAKKVTYKEYFVHTPLAYYWPDLNADMMVFAIRVQELWQNGGISFLLPTNGNDGQELASLEAVIANTKYKYEVLPNESVSVDGQGLHMATRTPCHTFFGEMLMRMQKDTDKLTVSNFFANMLSVFCRRGAIDSDYCKKTTARLE